MNHQSNTGLNRYSSALGKYLVEMIKEDILSGPDASVYREEAIKSLVGLPYKPAPRPELSEEQKFILELIEGVSNISNVLQMLKDIEIYIGQFPSSYHRQGISSVNYLRYHISSYFHEMYSLKEYIKKYLQHFESAYKHDLRSNTISQACKNIRKSWEMILYSQDKRSKKLLNIRGEHVHEKKYDDSDLSRLDEQLLHIQIAPETIKSSLKTLYSEGYKRTRKYWKATISKNNQETLKIIDHFFDTLYSFAFDDSGNILLPGKDQVSH